MHAFLPTLAAMELDPLTGTLGVIVAIVVSFAAITLVASYYRFQGIVRMAEDSDPEKMGATAEDVLHVQLARYLANCARQGISFSLALVKANNPDFEVRMDSAFVAALKKAARTNDITCVYDDETAAMLLESDPEDAENMFSRITGSVAMDCPDLDLTGLRVGIASYPGHGLSGKELIRVAGEGLEQSDAETPIKMPEIINLDEGDEEEAPDEEELDEIEIPAEEQEEAGAAFDEEETRSWKDRRKSAMLDELTGVLKPSAISPYMQRMMNEIRRKKQPAALFCIGINNIDHITRFHGEDAADAVLVAVSKILQDNVRGEDLIGRHEKSAFLVLAHASLEEAATIGKRVSSLVQHAEILSERKKLRTSITLGVATYPDHGRNLHQLYEAGQRVLDHSRANDIRAYAVYDPQIHDSIPSKPMRSIKSIKAD
jgi:diguanylate cyclase (GGDEF)-like protein